MAKQSCCGGTASARKGTANIGTLTGALRNTAETNASVSNGGSCQSSHTTDAAESCACQAEIPQARWILEWLQTPAGNVPRVSTRLAFQDVWGSWKCRWSIGRMDYKVSPGLYCAGHPDDRSPVLVTANYKMTFDRLRAELEGLDVWILVLDTDGVNVWCAAGKGTFGTEELVRRIEAVALDRVVTHRTVVVPQLGATGVAAHDVLKQSGFHVVYGPVRAEDLKAFLAAGMVATDAMRTVQFPFKARIVLTPMELVIAIKPLVITFGIMFILNAIGLGHYGSTDLVALVGAVFAGSVVAPALLPWIPGRAFSFKGLLVGLIWALLVNVAHGFPGMADFGWMKALAFFLILPALSAFCTMNFTGSSTYTSLSGVDREMKFALPAMLVSTLLGVALLLVGDITKIIVQ